VAEARALAGGKDDGFHLGGGPDFQMRRRLGISDFADSFNEAPT